MVNGRIVKSEIKSRVEVVDKIETTVEAVIVTIEAEQDGFKVRSQVAIDVAEQGDWQIGSPASVEINALQLEMPIRATR